MLSSACNPHAPTRARTVCEITTESCVSLTIVPLCPPPPGRKVLAAEEEEQRGCQALPGCPQVKGEPDHRESGVPGAREHGAEDRGGRAAQGVRPLQERGGTLRGQVWTPVRETASDQTPKCNSHNCARHARLDGNKTSTIALIRRREAEETASCASSSEGIVSLGLGNSVVKHQRETL